MELEAIFSGTLDQLRAVIHTFARRVIPDHGHHVYVVLTDVSAEQCFLCARMMHLGQSYSQPGSFFEANLHAKDGSMHRFEGRRKLTSLSLLHSSNPHTVAQALKKIPGHGSRCIVTIELRQTSDHSGMKK
jgi:hypothetical protein